MLSNEQEALQGLLRELLHRSDWGLDPSGRVSLSAGAETVTLDLPPGGADLHLCVILGVLPTGPGECAAALRAALAFNLFLERGRGAAVALSDEGTLLLCARLPAASLDALQLAHALANLGDVAADAREQLTPLPVAPTARAPVDALALPPMALRV